MIIPDNLLHTISFIAAVVACVIIVKAFLSHKQEDDKKNLHLYYISGITIFIIIELATYIFVHDDNSSNLLNTISFASTLSSIVLSVVAIVHGIVTARRGAEDVASSIKASQDLKDSADCIKEISSSFSNKMKDSSVEIEASVNQANEIMSNVKNELFDLKCNLQELIQANKNGFEQVTQRLDGINYNDNLRQKDKKSSDDQNKLLFFLHNSSISGCIAIYACYKASQKNDKTFKLEDLNVDSIGPSQLYYFYGYIMAASALGLLDVEVKEDNTVFVRKCELDGEQIKLLQNRLQEYVSSDDASIKRILKYLGF